MVLLSSQHALTTHYIPYMFYEMLLPSDGSLKTSLILFHFFLQGLILLWGFPRLVLLSANACMMLTAVSTAERQRSRRGSSQHKEHSLKRLSHTTLLSLLTPPSLLMLVVLLFHRPVLDIISYCCFLLLSLFFSFAVVQTRHFFLMLKLLLVFCDGCSALSFLLSRMSHLRG